jgi:sugar lactone lactonase YvrE
MDFFFINFVEGINGMLNISLYGPSGIVTDSSSGTLFVADTYNHRVISYAAGTVVAGGNGPGNSTTTLDFPYGLVYESVTKSLIIPNYSTNNIVRWVLGATNRAYVAGDVMGNPGSNSTFLNSPVGMTMDPMGNIYVADSGNNRIQFFMAGQSTATTIAGTSASGTNATQLNIPFWVILDNQLNLYVSDTFNNRVQKFLRY